MHHRRAILLVLCIAWLSGACNYGTNTPALTNPQSVPENPKFTVVVSPELSSTPTIKPSQAPRPESTSLVDYPGCFDEMKILEIVSDKPVEDSGILIAWPGVEYSLFWRIQNVGTCTWDSAYTLQPLGQNRITFLSESTTTVLNDRVPPGKSMMIGVKIFSPAYPGDYPIGWMLINGYRKMVGPIMKVDIRVVGNAENRPLPTMTRNPNVLFEASSTQVAPYGRVVLTWDVREARKVYFYTSGQNWISNQVPMKGVRIYYPVNDTAYNLRVANYDNTVESYKIEVSIEPPFGLPEIMQFELAPRGSLFFGSCVDINWKVRGGLMTSIRLFGNDTLLVTDGERIGAYSDCPTQIGLVTYTLVVSGPGGTTSKIKTLRVEP